jgi:hypothetical protein
MKIFLGLFIYACRLQLPSSNTVSSCEKQLAAVGMEAPSQCKEQVEAKAGPSGDCA